MMARNPNWWNYMHPPYLYHVLAANGSSSVIPAFNSLPSDHHHLQDPPQSWSQLPLSGNSGLSGEDEDRFGQNFNRSFQPKKLENWEDQMIISSSTATVNPPPRLPLQIADHHVKQEVISQKSNLFCGGGGDIREDHRMIMQQANDRRPANCAANWSQVMPAVSSSPRSCITSLGSSTNTILDFSCNKADNNIGRNQTTDHHSAISECNSTATGGAVSNKKARVQSSSSQPPLKVRKEKLGDRITALHQLVSPFGKTDTASVLLEAIGYIRFLQSQIEALSSPYLGHASKNMRNQPYEMEEPEKIKDLRSRGLCVVPVSCTQHVGSDNGADYWAPANYGSGF